MSLVSRGPNPNKRCFAPCQPGTYCECLGKEIERFERFEAPITELEIAKRCAEALGQPWHEPRPYAPDGSLWDPLNNPAQNQRVEWEVLRRGVRIFLLEQALEIEWVASGKCMMKEYPCRTIEEKRRAICMALCDVAGANE